MTDYQRETYLEEEAREKADGPSPRAPGADALAEIERGITVPPGTEVLLTAGDLATAALWCRPAPQADTETAPAAEPEAEP